MNNAVGGKHVKKRPLPKHVRGATRPESPGALNRKVFAESNSGDPALLRLKFSKMAESEFRFFRGSAKTFYGLWCDHRPRASLPTVWVCGDAHCENIGCYRGKNKIPYFDITDFDHACLASVDNDLARAATALTLAGVGNEASRFLSAYRQALATGKTQHIEREVAKGTVARLLREVASRKRKSFLATWVKKGRILPIADQTYRLTLRERKHAAKVFSAWARQRRRSAFFRVLDICGSLSGIGALGLKRYMVLVEGGQKTHLIDMKEAPPSALAKSCGQPQPPWSCAAERVATIQNFTQYVPIAHLGWTQFRKQSFVLSDFQPAEDRIEISSLAGADLRRFVSKWGRLLAWSHLRTASWRGAATVDELMEFAKTFGSARQRALLKRCQAIARQYRQAFREFAASLNER